MGWGYTQLVQARLLLVSYLLNDVEISKENAAIQECRNA
jgi:hypothetical protein